MANPQPDKFTMLANELLEQVPTFKFNGTQLRMVMIIWRYTFGFRRKDSEFSLTFLAKAIRAHKNLVARELKFLIDRKVLIVISVETHTESRTLRFNKDYDSWQVKRGPPNQVTVNQLGDTQSPNCGTPQSPNQVAPPVNQLGDQERKRSLKKVFKESIKEEGDEMTLKRDREKATPIFNHWLSKGLVNHRVFSPQIINQVVWKLNNYTEVELMDCITSYAEVLNNPESILEQRWGLDAFLEKGHFEKFLQDRDPYAFYARRSKALDQPKKTRFQKNKELLLGGRSNANDRGRSEIHSIQSGSGLSEPD